MSIQDLRSSRRSFLTGTGLIIAFAVVPKAFARESLSAVVAGGSGALSSMNAFIMVGADDTITVLSKHLEWGQGIYSGLAALVAEEIDADWSQMRAVHSRTDDKVYANLVMASRKIFFQGTFGSSGIANSYQQYRAAGAAARAMLVAAAAEEWAVPAMEITVSKGVISHAGSGKTSRFGAFADKAANQIPPDSPVLKDGSSFQIIGRELPRLDTADKTTGKAVYTIDLHVDNMLVAMVKQPDQFGATVKSFEDSEARKVKGVVDVKKVSSGVAVYATDTYSAIKARDLLSVEWDLSNAETRSSEQLASAYAKKLGDMGLEAARKGDIDSALGRRDVQTHESRIVFPFLAHAPMEPMDALFVPSEDGSLDIFAGSQLPGMDQKAAAQVLGLDPTAVRLNAQLTGGGFGRRGTWGAPYMVEAAEVFKAIGGNRPLKHLHSRENDIRGGYYRPMFLHELKGAIDGEGNIVAWDHAIVGQRLTPGEGAEHFMVEGAEDLPYAVPNLRVTAHEVALAVQPMFWRSVGHSHTGFAVETFVDELLELAGKDPVEGRLTQLAEERSKGVLKRAAEIANWGASLPEGRQRGVAVVKAFNSYVAEVAEISRDSDGTPRVHKVWCAVDCGVAVNPNMIRAQMEGGIGFGLGAILFSEVTLGEGGSIQQSNFHDYRVLRMNEMPEIQVSIIESREQPTGVGEPGVPPIGPAVANAWRKLTGERVRRLPMVPMSS
ncbi:xanthine dehydrogenase family protein molybdopterin-binding subunit [Rhizobium aegyptiacum]|uniref:xanthine dehydrogenase family protein molybdopterin-binding subunit n=1 Tax=Rhizobium aegyptiacum TaxID=1764550 RepID=UPI0007E5698A|nr:molybdopterin cofactor-binding domain-containing protein [Rhizobium aegyptiacum]